jgi:dCTP deaminase
VPVLSNAEIHAYIEAGRIVIDPEPQIEPGLPDSLYDEASLTLHMGTHVQVPKKLLQVAFDLGLHGDFKSTIDAALDSVPIPPSGWVLHPNEFVLSTVHETIGFPLLVGGKDALMGRIEGRSRYARLGLLVHATAPTIQPGWTGKLTFELKNLGYFPIILRPESPIGQLIVERVDGEVVQTSGEFDDQDTATGRSRERRTRR